MRQISSSTNPTNNTVGAILATMNSISPKGRKAVRRDLAGVVNQQGVRELLARGIGVTEIMGYAKQNKKRISQPAQMILAEHATGVVLH